MPNKTINDNDNEDCRVLESFYTQYGTKLFVKDGVLVEQKLKSRPSSSAVPVDRNRKLLPVPSPYVGIKSRRTHERHKRHYCRNSVKGCSHFLIRGFRRPLNDPRYSPLPPPPRKKLSLAEIKKLSHESSIETAQVALAYYNRKHPTNYALVRPIESNCFMRNGFWDHCVFLAKPVEGDGDSTERCFFAELKANGMKFGRTNYLVTLCRPIDGTQTTLGCEICDWMPRPLSGFLKGNPQVQPRLLRSSSVPGKKRASASGTGVEGSGGHKRQTFCLEIQDLHKYIPNFDASDNDWMQYM